MTEDPHSRLDPHDLMDGEYSLTDEANKIFASPDQWMDEPHPLLDGKKPRDLLNTGKEQQLRDLIRDIRFVGQT